MNSQLQNAVRELSNVSFAHLSFLGGGEKASQAISEGQIAAARSVQSDRMSSESW